MDKEIKIKKPPIIKEEVVLSKERFDELIAAEDELKALKSIGVDNWKGYEIAMNMLKGEW